MQVNLKVSRSRAFTLVELLVVISILAMLAALAIPQLRMVSKERNIRETSRVVASLFSQASQRAQTDGAAGVLLRRNPNFIALGGYGYAVTSMSLLRKVPDYSGDQEMTMAPTPFGVGGTSYGVPYEIRIPKPIDQDDVQVVQENDLISFGHSSTQYRITNINEVLPEAPANMVPFLDLTLDSVSTAGVPLLPDPSLSAPAHMLTAGLYVSGVPFRVERSPRILKSSTLELPEGYAVDLRFSGFTMVDSGFEGKATIAGANVPRAALATNVLEPFPRTSEPTVSSGTFEVVDYADSDIAVLFDGDGKLDQIYMRKVFDFNQDGAIGPVGNQVVSGTIVIGDRVGTYSRLALDSMYLFVTEQEQDAAVNPLARDTNQWVAVNGSSGVVNVGYNIASSSTMAGLGALYNGPGNVANAADRTLFNNEIIASRNLVNLGSATQ